MTLATMVTVRGSSRSLARESHPTDTVESPYRYSSHITDILSTYILLFIKGTVILQSCQPCSSKVLCYQQLREKYPSSLELETLSSSWLYSFVHWYHRSPNDCLLSCSWVTSAPLKLPCALQKIAHCAFGRQRQHWTKKNQGMFSFYQWNVLCVYD